MKNAKRITQLSALFLICLLLPQAKTLAATIYVDNHLTSDCTSKTYSVSNRDCSGNDGIAYTTVQKASDVAQVGDQIFIRSGTYDETLQAINSGTYTAPIIFSAYQNEEVKINGINLDAANFVRVEKCKIRELTQWGITWIFDTYYPVSQFANGDWWVLGPVTIARITPDFTGDRHGWEVNPHDINKQGFDSRIGEFSPSFVPSLPYVAAANSSIVKTISNLATDCLCPSNPNHKCPLVTAAVLTVADQIPQDNGRTIFRPPYFGSEKPMYLVNSIRTDLLPSVEPTVYVPTLEWVRTRFQRLQLDHKVNWMGRAMHPDLNMPDYGGDIALNTGDAALRLVLDDSSIEKMPALINYLQTGIDLYHILKNGGYWPANGGHDSGRKLPIIFTAILLDNQEMKNVVRNARYDTFQEDGMLYFSSSANEGKGQVLFGHANGEGCYWSNQVFDSCSRTGKDPYGYIDCNVPGTSYQAGINSMIWKGPVIAMQLMPETSDIWNNDNFVDYVDRWVTFGAWAQPDSCAPVMGVCSGGENAGKICTYANPNACPGSYCAVGLCEGGPYAGQGCGSNNGPSPNNDCGTGSSCGFNTEFYKVTYGPDPRNPGKCIPDTDSTDGIGRHPYRHGQDANTGGYHSSFVDAMWDKYRLYHCVNGIQDADEQGVDCGGSCVYDNDKDGYLGRLCDRSDARYDCNDNDPKVNPGMPEICTQAGEFDDNCDGRMCPEYYVDTDKDGINDCEDNCPVDCNPNQQDTDFDNKGNACDDMFQLTEDFELMADGDIARQRMPGGLSFEVINGWAGIGTSTHWGYTSRYLYIPGKENTTNLVVTKQGRGEWSNYTLKVLTGQKYTTGGFVLHYKDPANYYLMNLRTGKLEKVENNVITIINGVGNSITMAWGGGNNYYSITSIVDSSGVQFIVTKDNSTTMAFTDSLPHTQKGSIGFFERGYSSGNYFIFDNIEIYFENTYSGPRGICNQKDIKYGDVNSDGEISAYDAALTAQAAVDLITLTPEQFSAADVDGSKDISAYDAALIAQKAVGLIDKFPVE